MTQRKSREAAEQARPALTPDMELLRLDELRRLLGERLTALPGWQAMRERLISSSAPPVLPVTERWLIFSDSAAASAFDTSKIVDTVETITSPEVLRSEEALYGPDHIYVPRAVLLPEPDRPRVVTPRGWLFRYVRRTDVARIWPGLLQNLPAPAEEHMPEPKTEAQRHAQELIRHHVPDWPHKGTTTIIAAVAKASTRVLDSSLVRRALGRRK